MGVGRSCRSAATAAAAAAPRTTRSSCHEWCGASRVRRLGPVVVVLKAARDDNVEYGDADDDAADDEAEREVLAAGERTPPRQDEDAEEKQVDAAAREAEAEAEVLHDRPHAALAHDHDDAEQYQVQAVDDHAGQLERILHGANVGHVDDSNDEHHAHGDHHGATRERQQLQKPSTVLARWRTVVGVSSHRHAHSSGKLA
eukprot:CAMPEP_0198338596 /NCGR_PEP_ID=MMETSP1450-20131203/35436_1 /TAXON_ID=753684 ORGANISM="Madagascaria erythrocladiodes, Strain CCMP3234" /NCGR_SAMPLE_ID=MMETSP1450 /ASSEMBLY_ACC=CAM_ASM_001115 /LENGTH=199 /DNA_ID=CAMNT_0044043479 /DNA_START=20 /DNA_END=619 /DNA_ORIENTATION=-